MTHSLSEALVVLPEHRPSFAGRTANKDVGMVLALFILYAESVTDMARNPASREGVVRFLS